MSNIIWKTVLYFVVTIIITAFLALIQQSANLSYEKITLPQLAPAIGFLIMILFFKSLKTQPNVELNYLIAIKTITSFLVPIFLSFVGFLVCRYMGVNIGFTQNALKTLPWMMGGLMLGAVGEELGWRSFLQQTLEKNYSLIVSAVIVGLVWGLWHVGHYKNGIGFMVGFLLFTISASIILAWILRETNFNLIISAIFHLSINIGFLLFFKEALTNPKVMIVNGVVWLIPAIIIAMTGGKELAKI